MTIPLLWNRELGGSGSLRKQAGQVYQVLEQGSYDSLSRPKKKCHFQQHKYNEAGSVTPEEIFHRDTETNNKVQRTKLLPVPVANINLLKP